MCTYSYTFPPLLHWNLTAYRYFVTFFPLLNIPNSFSWLLNPVDYLIHALSLSKSKISILNWSNPKT